MLLYLPLLLPAALSDFSPHLADLASWLPSYGFYRRVKGILIGDGGAAVFYPDGAYLLCTGLAALVLTHLLVKRRWPM